MTDGKLQSPERRSMSSQISAMGTRLGMALNLEGGRPDFDRNSRAETMVNSGESQGKLTYLFSHYLQKRPRGDKER